MQYDSEIDRRKGDVKVKEGLLFLKNFYNERATIITKANRGGSISELDQMLNGGENKRSPSQMQTNQVIMPSLSMCSAYKRRRAKIG